MSSANPLDRILIVVGIIVAITGCGLGLSTDPHVSRLGAGIVGIFGVFVAGLGARKAVMNEKHLRILHLD